MSSCKVSRYLVVEVQLSLLSKLTAILHVLEVPTLFALYTPLTQAQTQTQRQRQTFSSKRTQWFVLLFIFFLFTFLSSSFLPEIQSVDALTGCKSTKSPHCLPLLCAIHKIRFFLAGRGMKRLTRRGSWEKSLFVYRQCLCRQRLYCRR